MKYLESSTNNRNTLKSNYQQKRDSRQSYPSEQNIYDLKINIYFINIIFFTETKLPD